MTGKEYLQRVRKHIYYIFDRDSIEQELAGHLQDSMDDLKEEGYSPEEAENLAVERMGSPEETGRQLNREHHPLLGYTWLASSVVLGFLLVILAYMVCHAAYMGIKTATPITIEDSVKNYSVDIAIDLPTHKLVLDNISIDEEGRYFLTYRAWPNYSYSRAGWSLELFSIESSDGKSPRSGGYRSHSFMGFCGYMRFNRPADGILYVRTKNGELLEINLNEVEHEESR